MSESSKPLTEKESLELITQMINRAKDNFVDTGIGPILWGAVITFCSLVQAAQIHFDFDLPFDIWWLAMLAIIPQVFISIKEKRERKAKGWEDSMMGYIWLCFGIGIFVVNFINRSLFEVFEPVIQHYRNITGQPFTSTWTFATCYLLFVFGFPTIITGASRKFHLMTFGGIFCWVSAVVACFTSTKIDFVLMAVSATLAWLIPGLFIERKYRARKKANV
ncbi:MAG TPA: hypothetical protein VFV31_04390 [Chitinophagaceae bacterium]|nr:hypothetical protein [Chitinophagaceae bacterium]